MLAIEHENYTREEIISAIHAERQARNVRFRYDLLDKEGRFKRSLSGVVSGQIDFSAFSTIKRTAKFKVREYKTKPQIARADTQKTFTDLSGWTLTKTTEATGYIKADDMVTSSATTASMESVSGTLPVGWTEWNDPNGLSMGLYTGVVNNAISLNKTDTGTTSFGIQTSSKTLISAGAGDWLRISFFYKPVSLSSDINYVYAMANDGLGNLTFADNATITDVGSGWFRYDSYVVAPRTTGYGLLIAYSGNDSGTFRIDEVWFSRNTERAYVGEATSPIIDMSDDETLTGDVPTVSGTTVTWTKSGADQYNSSQIGPPINNLMSRYSLNAGATWSSWANQSTGAPLAGLPVGSNMSDLQVQFKWQYTRYTWTDSPRITSLNLTIDYEKDSYIPSMTEIDFTTDRIKPYMEIRMHDGEWIDFPLGVFLLSSPTRVDENDIVYREIEAYDSMIIIDEDRFTSRHYIASGTLYTDAVETILRSAGITTIAIQTSSETLTASREFKVGTSKLEAVNELLQAINYTSVWVDANGYFKSEPYISPADRSSEYDYIDDDLSIMYNGMEEELDLFDVANSWVLVESNPEKPAKVAVRVNDDPESPVSTVNLGRSIVDFREIQDVSSQASLDALADRIKTEASQVFGKLKFKTALVPFHEYMDVIRVRYTPLGIDTTFSETSWSMTLEAGGEMEHEARKVVII